MKTNYIQYQNKYIIKEHIVYIEKLDENRWCIHLINNDYVYISFTSHEDAIKYFKNNEVLFEEVQ